MKRLLAFLCLATLLSSCASQRVVTMGYLDPAAPAFAPGGTFAVAPNAEASNVIFDRELGTKIEKLLAAQGFKIAAPSEADHTVRYQYGVEGRTVTTDRPVTHFGPRYFVTGSTGRSYIVQGYDYVTYVPEIHTLYLSRLGITVTPRGKTDPVWIGETHSETISADLREQVDYLLAASFRFFGKNTPKQESVTIKPDDPALLTLESATPNVQKGTLDGPNA